MNKLWLVGLANAIFFQWLFVRLAFSEMELSGAIHRRWAIIGLIIPLTGWWEIKHIFVGKFIINKLDTDD